MPHSEIAYVLQTCNMIFQVDCALFADAELCHKFAQNLVERKQPLRGIAILCKAIDKIQLIPSQLTSIHADLCQVRPVSLHPSGYLS